MKTYQEIKQKHSDTYNKIMNDCQVFWAFSPEQFKEGKEKCNLKEGEKLVNIFGGGVCPKKNVDKMINGLKEADKTQKKEMKEFREIKEEAILYELKNHECFYTTEIDDVVELFKGTYTTQEIRKVYNKHKGANQ